MTRLPYYRILATVTFSFLLTAQLTVAECDESSLAESEADAQSRVAYDRFLALLRKQPRQGTALDRVYAFHIEQGTLDEFTSSLKDEAATSDANGVASMLLGLVEFQRGHDSEAAAALQNAETKRPDDPLAAWFHGRALVRLGQADPATEAFERAILRSPAKADLLQIYQELGRAHRRSRQPEKAGEIWKRMEVQFPDDIRVKEQITAIQYEEGDFEAALKRYADLAAQHTDSYQAATFALTAGDLKLKLGRTEEALTDFERQLTKLDPESWLYRDARRRIEDVFLRSDDLAGLVVYYETWLATHPEDLDAMSRVGRVLAQQGRLEDARGWYTKALERAPSDIALREAMIEHLIREDKYADAIAQYEQLHRYDSSNADHVEEWGLLYLNRRDLSQDERRRKAAEVWQTLITDRPDDPVTISRVADLLRRAELSEKAIELYQKAIELAPGEPQYKEYLGEYFHQLKRSDEALAIWNSMAEGELRTTDNLARLSDVLRSFRYRDEALAAMQAACELTPTFGHRVQFARLLRDDEPNVPRHSVAGTNPAAELRGTLALQQLDIAESIAESAEEREQVLEERIKTLIATGQLQQKTQELAAELAAGANATADRWRTLSLYYEAGSQMPSAIEAITTSLQVDAGSVASWTVAAGLYEKTGRNGDAADANRKLSVLDRRFLTEYLKKIATLEQKLGRLKQAQQAGKDLLAAAPGNPEHFQFYANLCFQLGQKEEGLNALRRSVRTNPSDDNAVLALARAVSDQMETAESIELYWRAFDQASDVDARSAIVTSLAELHLRTNQFDRLIQKLELRGKELNQQRDIAICLSAAFRAAGDVHSARQKLESLLDANSRDVSLLADLSKMAEDEDDLEAAADYQRRINIIAPSDDGRSRLAGILLKLGDVSEAESLWVRASESETDPVELFRSIDHLISIDSTDTARTLCERIVQRDPENWEALLRLGLLQWHSGHRDKAMKHFDAIVAMKKDANTLSAEAAKRMASGSSANATSHISYISYSSPHGYGGYLPYSLVSGFAPAIRREIQASALVTLLLEQSEEARMAAMYNAMYSGHQPGMFGYSGSGKMPDDFGEARIIGLAARYLQAKESGTDAAFLDDLEQRGEKEVQAAWDAHHLRSLNPVVSIEGMSEDQALDLAEKLARSGDIEGRVLLLKLSAANMTNAEILAAANMTSAVIEVSESYSDAIGLEEEPSKVPVSAERLQLIVESFESVLAVHPEWLQGNERLTVLAECRNLNRIDLVNALAGRLVKDVCSTAQLSAGLRLSLSLELLDTEAALTLMSRIDTSSDVVSTSPTAYYGYVATFPHDAIAILAKRAVKEKNWQALRTTLTWFLDYKVRHAGDPAAIPAVPCAASGYQSTAFTFSGSGNDDDKMQYPEFGRDFDAGDFRLLDQICVGMVIAASERDQLTVWYEEQKPLSSSTRALYLELLQSAFAWLDESKEEAVMHLIRAVEHVPGDVQLRIKLVELCEHIGNDSEALALLDKLPENDPALLKARELKALDLAFRTNNKARARQAAERLYGLQLDGQSQELLRARLRKLGMRELADEVDARSKKNEVAPRRPTPLELLEQYEKTGNTPAAVQIAQQLLRRTSHTAGSGFQLGPGYATDDSEIVRERAFKVLKSSGELGSLIERHKAQLEKSPNSRILTATLIEYLRADGRTEEADEWQNRLVARYPQNSAHALWTAATQLENSGQIKEACAKYMNLLEKYPAAFAAYIKEAKHVLLTQGSIEDVADILMKTDFNSFRSGPMMISETIKLLLQRKPDRTRAAALLDKALEEFPEWRQSFVACVENESDWQTPELFPFLSQMFVPASAGDATGRSLNWNDAQSIDWYGDWYGLGFEGVLETDQGMLPLLVSALESGDRRSEFVSAVKTAQQSYPEWPAGDVLLALAAIEESDPEVAHRLIQAFVDHPDHRIPESYTISVAEQLIAADDDFRNDAIGLLEKTVLHRDQESVDFGTRAAVLLRNQYVGTNQAVRGRQAVITRSGFFGPESDDGSHPLIRESKPLRTRFAAAWALKQLGDPVSAIGLLKVDEGKNADELEELRNYRLPEELNRTVSGEDLLRSFETASAAAITPRVLIDEMHQSLAQKPPAARPRLDLLPVLKGASSSTMTFECGTIEAMRRGRSKTSGQLADLAALADALNIVMNSSEADSSLIIAGVYVILTSQDEASIAAISTALDAHLRRPVQPRSESDAFSIDRLTKQDSEIGLGFLAKQIEQNSALEPLADLMMERALAIARQWPDKRYLSALLHQRGTTLLAMGDKGTAEAAWAEMLQLVLAEPDASRSGVELKRTSNGNRPAVNIAEELRKNLLKDEPAAP